MFSYELFKLHHLERQALNVVVRYSEPERRQKYAKRYAARVGLWFVAIIVSFVLVQLFVSPVQCENGQATEWDTVCMNCSLQHCLDCSEAGKDGCDLCEDGYLFDVDTESCIDDAC